MGTFGAAGNWVHEVKDMANLCNCWPTVKVFCL